MKKNCRRLLTGCSLLALSALAGCAGGINRDIREANNNFRYLDAYSAGDPLTEPEGLDKLKYSTDFDLPGTVIRDSRAAITGRHVDVRPPQKLIPLDPEVITAKDGDLAQIWFHADENGREMTANGLFTVLIRFLNGAGIDIESVDPENSFVRTDWYEATEFATAYDNQALADGALIYRQKYLFRLVRNRQGVPGIIVQITDNIIERSDGEELLTGLNRFEPGRFAALMANRLMLSYHQQQVNSEAGADRNVEITIGKDNNDLPCWILNASFDETYQVLTEILNGYGIFISEYSSTAGEIRFDYSELDPEDWAAHETEPWGLESGKYTFKIGLFRDKSTITLYDKQNRPVDAGVISRMYAGFSISLTNQFIEHRKKIKK